MTTNAELMIYFAKGKHMSSTKQIRKIIPEAHTEAFASVLTPAYTLAFPRRDFLCSERDPPKLHARRQPRHEVSGDGTETQIVSQAIFKT